MFFAPRQMCLKFVANVPKMGLLQKQEKIPVDHKIYQSIKIENSNINYLKIENIQKKIDPEKQIGRIKKQYF